MQQTLPGVEPPPEEIAVSNTIDKSTWAPGPWQTEPDLEEWTDDATGLTCRIVRIPGRGYLCGYVGVPPEHPWYGADYGSDPAHPGESVWDEDSPADRENAPDCLINVHGGVTYSGKGVGVNEGQWVFGFDCTHSGDLAPGPSMFGGVAFEGYDVYRTLEYVRKECTSLAFQLSRVQGA